MPEWPYILQLNLLNPSTSFLATKANVLSDTSIDFIKIGKKSPPAKENDVKRLKMIAMHDFIMA